MDVTVFVLPTQLCYLLGSYTVELNPFRYCFPVVGLFWFYLEVDAQVPQLIKV